MKERFDELINSLLDGGLFLEQAVELLERKMIESALERAAGNQSAASKALGIHRNTIQRKIAQYQPESRRIRRKPVGRAVSKKARNRRAS